MHRASKLKGCSGKRFISAESYWILYIRELHRIEGHGSIEIGILFCFVSCLNRVSVDIAEKL